MSYSLVHRFVWESNEGMYINAIKGTFVLTGQIVFQLLSRSWSCTLEGLPLNLFMEVYILSYSYLRMVDVFIDLGTAGENVKRVKRYTFLRKHATGSATTELHIVHVERGMSWEDAMDRWSELEGAKEGFYLSHQVWVSPTAEVQYLYLRWLEGSCLLLRFPSENTYLEHRKSCRKTSYLVIILAPHCHNNWKDGAII